MVFDQRKKVRLQENERLDLPDALAISDLRDGDIQAMMRAVMSDPGPATSPDFHTRGCIFRGFTYQVLTGVVRILNVAGAAMDTAGNLLLRDSGVQIDIGLALSSGNYVYAYYVESPTDSDARKNLDPTSGLEASASMTTRTTRGVSFYRDTSDQLTATIGGVLRPLIPICFVTTDGAGIATNGTHGEDRRPMLIHASDSTTIVEESNLISGTVTTGGGEDPNNHPTLGSPYPVISTQTWIRRLAEQFANATGKKWWQVVTRNLESVGAEVTAARGSAPSVNARISLEHDAAGHHTNVNTDHITCNSITVAASNYLGGPSVHVPVGDVWAGGYVHAQGYVSAGPANNAVMSAAGVFTGASSSVSGQASSGSVLTGSEHITGSLQVDVNVNCANLIAAAVVYGVHGSFTGNVTAALIQGTRVWASQGFGAAAGFSFYQDGAQDTGMYSDADGNLWFRSNNVNMMRLSSPAWGVPYVNGVIAVGDSFGNLPLTNAQLCMRNFRNNVVGYGWTLAAGSAMLSSYNVQFLSHGAGSGAYNVRSRTTISAESSNTANVWDLNGQTTVNIVVNISGGFWQFACRNGAGTPVEAGFNFASVGMPVDASGIPSI